MRDFVAAALPWVLGGIAIAIICAGMGREKTEESEKKLERRMAVGMALGLLLGVALNRCGLWESHALGIAMGPLWGMALAVLTDGGYDDGDAE